MQLYDVFSNPFLDISGFLHLCVGNSEPKSGDSSEGTHSDCGELRTFVSYL